MSSLITTVSLTLLLVFIALVLLASGYLLTGKSRLRPGGCGRAPCDKEKKSGCSLCQTDEQQKKE